MVSTAWSENHQTGRVQTGHAARREASERRTGFTLVELLVVIAIIGVLIGLLLPAVQMAREAGRRNHCSNNLRQLGVAIHGYASPTEMLPRGVWAGWGHSWTAEILPFLEAQSLFDLIPTPWDDNGSYSGSDARSQALRQVMQTPVPTFHCPGERSGIVDPRTINGLENRAINSYLACAGGDAANDNASMVGSNGMFPAVRFVGVSQPAAKKRLVEIQDGASKTLMISEATHLNDTPFLGDRFLFFHPDADTGSGNDFSEVLGSTFYAINLSHTSSVTDEVECSFSSFHPRGVNACLADGSTRFIDQGIKPDVWRGYGSINGGEIGGDQ